ncbi:hypothetical protein FH972_014578 [Carpinus fangiana]|uniref:O-methyltransferase domain-containing protein n=1 Tax=Carpinus fangiana TaxID=176857 RepID=A0A5N6RA24_9ROSI|nr:hypothetical protein FH972_014578 [Carpinus fangiana]
MEAKETQAMVQGQAEIWQQMFGFVDSRALKCVVELCITDIIHSHDGLITLSQIAYGIDSPSPDIPNLTHIRRLLVRKNIFTEHHHSDSVDDVPYVAIGTVAMPWPMCQRMGYYVQQGPYGLEIWDFASKNHKFNNIFNNDMACTAKIVTRGIMEEYKDGFGCLGSLVNVGGGIGELIVEIVKAHPHIKGINFGLPHLSPQHPCTRESPMLEVTCLTPSLMSMQFS